MNWPWRRRKSDRDLLVESLQDQVAYLRGQVERFQRQVIVLSDARAAWNIQALAEREGMTKDPPQAVNPAAGARAPSEMDGGHFANSLYGDGHIDEQGRRPVEAVDERSLMDDAIEEAMLERERAAMAGAGGQTNPNEMRV